MCWKCFICGLFNAASRTTCSRCDRRGTKEVLFVCLNCGQYVLMQQGDTFPRDTEHCSHEFERTNADAMAR